MHKQLDLSEYAPWRQRYLAPAVLAVQLARRHPARGLVISTRNGQYQLYAWNLPDNQLRQLTRQPEGVYFGAISPDGRYIYYMQDDNGNEIGHFVRIPWEGGMPENITPGRGKYSAFGLNFSRTGNMIGTVISDDHGFHAVAIPVEQDGVTGRPAIFHHTTKMMFGPVLSNGGEIGVLVSTERTTFQHNILIAYDLATRKLIGTLSEKGASLTAHNFSPVPGGSQVLGVSNGTGYNRLFTWDLKTNRRQDLEIPGFEGDISVSDWSDDGKEVLLAGTYLAEQKLAVYNLETGGLKRLDHPQGFYGMGAPFAPAVYFHGCEFIAGWQDATHPPQVISLDHNGQRIGTVLPAGEVPDGYKIKSITFLSLDGERIQGWLGVPDGEGPFPTILNVHGGPETQTVDYFFPNAQAWLDHGFAWLAINYRGSTGFGREFREKIWGNVGHWEITDMLAAREWLIKEGIADPQSVIPHGWSYGGYLVLLALGKFPDLWAAGLAGTATTDWTMEYEDLSPAMRGYSVALLGGTPQEKPETYAAASPINYADRIQAPVLIIQGRNDTRTPARPVEFFEKKMRELGKEIDVCWYAEGHAGGGVDQEIEHQEIMMRFAYRILNRKTR